MQTARPLASSWQRALSAQRLIAQPLTTRLGWARGLYVCARCPPASVVAGEGSSSCRASSSGAGGWALGRPGPLGESEIAFFCSRENGLSFDLGPFDGIRFDGARKYRDTRGAPLNGPSA